MQRPGHLPDKSWHRMAQHTPCHGTCYAMTHGMSCNAMHPTPSMAEKKYNPFFAALLYRRVNLSQNKKQLIPETGVQF